jgi:hypothetical protein
MGKRYKMNNRYTLNKKISTVTKIIDPPVSPPVDSSALLTTGLYYDSDDLLGPPAKNKRMHLEAEEEGGEVDDMDDFARRPVLMETVTRAWRTKTVPTGPVRKSARLQGPASAIPIMQRAQEFTAAKNRDPTGMIPPPPSASEFVVLRNVAEEHLETVAHDAGLAFSVESGTATDVISFIRAKEEAQAALAFAAARRAHSEAGEASLLREAPAESNGIAQAKTVTLIGEASADPVHVTGTAPHANARGRSKTRLATRRGRRCPGAT